jgi:hypothetical protein
MQSASFGRYYPTDTVQFIRFMGAACLSSFAIVASEWFLVSELHRLAGSVTWERVGPSVIILVPVIAHLGFSWAAYRMVVWRENDDVPANP